jgi:hypothetical protein
MPDLQIDNYGSISLITPLTAAGEEWVEANLKPEPWQWFGRGFAIEPRYAGAILQGALDEGLEIL